MVQTTDVLVIGSGIAGLAFALRMAESFPDRNIVIATKNEAPESNTRYAQGGIAAVWNHDNDDYRKHLMDTLKAGDFLNDEKIVSLFVSEAPERLKELIDWGAEFDKNAQGQYDLALEGGHSEKRILHHKDFTGHEISRALIAKVSSRKNIRLLPRHFAIDLLTETEGNGSRRCTGAILLNLDTLTHTAMYARITMLATGGIGQVYAQTTNPSVATGDGIAMAMRAGARLKDMEFIQFHPTALYTPGESPAFLISEAVRGMGAVLKNRQGTEFMKFYSPQESLAPRDLVSRAIAFELKEDECVFLDARKIDTELFRNHFPNIHAKCLETGIDPAKQMIPVVPAAHYLCGGISTNEWGSTTILHLYACGECAATGLHGGNRLASNSLTEALVFADRSYRHIRPKLQDILLPSISQVDISPMDFSGDSTEALLLKKEVNELMSASLGIVRNRKSMEAALEKLRLLSARLASRMEQGKYYWKLYESRNILQTAILITEFSLRRKENRGTFYSEDIKNKILY